MAAAARQLVMGTGQVESRLRMIEGRRQPGRGGVALTAILPELPVMGIIFGVA